jgi:hypothetical protein
MFPTIEVHGPLVQYEMYLVTVRREFHILFYCSCEGLLSKMELIFLYSLHFAAVAAAVAVAAAAWQNKLLFGKVGFRALLGVLEE